MRRALACRLAEESPIVVVTEPLSLVRERTRPALANRIRTIASLPNLRELTPIHYPERIPICGPWLKQFGQRMLATELDQVLAPFGKARRIVCYDSPYQHGLVGTLGEHLSVYLAIDDRTVTVKGEPIAGEEANERDLLSKVDRVVCVSTPLAATIRARAPEGKVLPVDVVTNGYDEKLFDPYRYWQEPVALQDLPRPRILVTGHISERIDWDGIARAAIARPGWSWAFVGPADAGMTERIADISKVSSAAMTIHQPVPHEMIPAWIAHCDACAVPYRLNAFTLASSPLKAIEYLGMGAPLLSTSIPSLAQFADAIAWVEEANGPSYASALDALAHDGRAPHAVARRCAAVAGESWRNKALCFSNLLNA